jgi:cellulose biosynthesis protein BcsQ
MPPDENSGLKSRFEFDRFHYKVIPGRRRIDFTNQPRHGALHAELGTPSRIPPENVSALSPAFGIEGNLVPVPAPTVSAGARLATPVLAFSAAPGGAGKSTILSSLARILSSMGENLLLIYPQSQSAVPMYFGGEPLSGQVRRYIPGRGACGGLHLYAQAEESELESSAQWLPREVNSMSNRVGRVLCEVTSSQREVADIATINLRILVPDIASVLSVNDDLLSGSGEITRARTFYLLNKYDASVRFHRDVRERLSWMLGDRLLPFTIRRSDEFAEALAAGLTIVNYAPKAAVVSDLKLLAQWVRSSMEINPDKAATV